MGYPPFFRYEWEGCFKRYEWEGVQRGSRSAACAAQHTAMLLPYRRQAIDLSRDNARAKAPALSGGARERFQVSRYGLASMVFADYHGIA